MGIFKTPSTLTADIEKATNENNTQEKWGLIMEVCDKVTNGAASSKECLKIIVKRLNHTDPHVVIQAITLLDACVSNCGKQFHLEIASREFETEFKKLLQKSQPTVNTRLKLCLKKWAESEFRSDPQLNLIPSLYQKLRSEGHDFSDPASATPKREPVLSKDPNVVSSQQEEEDIAKAIELSLKESGSSNQSPKKTGGGGGSLYPSAMLATVPAAEPRKVRALYDFEAAEDNELTFQAGEIIMVLDDSDPNWWKGQNQRGEGLFPSNFVSSDLNAEPEPSVKSKKSVQFSDEKKEEEAGGGKDQVVEINEEKIDRLLHLLHEADPEDPSTDSEEMLKLEQLVNQMGPLIDTELERVDRKHAQLTQLSSDLVEAINLYHTLMREPDRSMMMGMGPSGYGGMPGFPGQTAMPGMYNMPPSMYNPNLPGMSFPGMLPPQYGMPQLRHDMGQMSVSSIPQFPPPQQAMPSMSHNGPTSLPQQQQPQQQQIPPAQPQQPPVPGHPQMGPQQAPPPPHAQHMPNMPPHQPPANAAPPQHMMNMNHMQSPLPQNFQNPTSPPPVVSSTAGPVPTSLPPQQGVLPNQPQTQRPGFPSPYGPPQQLQQQQPPQQQPPPQPQAPATAPPPNGMNTLQHHPGPMTHVPPYMQMGPPPGGHMPHHHMLGMMGPPPGTPLSINTATASPQNIPIYQQQR